MQLLLQLLQASVVLTMPTIKKALDIFQGVKRRFEYIIKGKKIVYVDDYAHHPTEIEAFLKSMKSMYPGQKVDGDLSASSCLHVHVISLKDFQRALALRMSCC